MNRKATGLVTSLLAVILLLLVSCAPAAPTETKEVKEEVTGKKEVGTITGGEGMTVTETTETTAPATPTTPTTPEAVGEALVKDSLGRMVPAPQYGGRVTLVFATEPFYFDETFGHGGSATANKVTNETMVQGNYLMGPSGTKKTNWQSGEPAWDTYQGRLAESWEFDIDRDTVTYHIRKGVRFALNPDSEASRLVNGREMDAYDVVFSHERLYKDSTKSIQVTGGHLDQIMVSAEATDKWTVVEQSIAGQLPQIWRYTAVYGYIIPPEVVKKYGDMGDWKNSVGTGAHYLADYVKGSSLTFKRNTNYWMTDPFFPENPLPYVDEVKWLIIPDKSTKFAALRTGKVDMLHTLTPEDAEQLFGTNPDLKSLVIPGNSPASLYMRVDKPELPFKDLRVRRALAMAINNQEIVDDYYKGEAQIITYPVLNIPEFEGVIWPLDTLPQSTRELYEYHPDKARELLAEAGYPDGFKTQIIATQDQVDLLSIVAAYWDDVGITLEIKVMEAAAKNSMARAAQHPEGYAGGVSSTFPYYFAESWSQHPQSYARQKDPIIDQARLDSDANYFDEEKKRQIMRDVIPHMLEQNYITVLPGPNIYHVWQPWVMQYGGEIEVGRLEAYAFTRFLWIDEALKKQMLGK